VPRWSKARKQAVRGRADEHRSPLRRWTLAAGTQCFACLTKPSGTCQASSRVFAFTAMRFAHCIAGARHRASHSVYRHQRETNSINEYVDARAVVVLGTPAGSRQGMLLGVIPTDLWTFKDFAQVTYAQYYAHSPHRRACTECYL
jgi:hypothetical protein